MRLARAHDRIEARPVVPRRRKRSASERRQPVKRVIRCVDDQRYLVLPEHVASRLIFDVSTSADGLIEIRRHEVSITKLMSDFKKAF